MPCSLEVRRSLGGTRAVLEALTEAVRHLASSWLALAVAVLLRLCIPPPLLYACGMQRYECRDHVTLYDAQSGWRQAAHAATETLDAQDVAWAPGGSYLAVWDSCLNYGCGGMTGAGADRRGRGTASCLHMQWRSLHEGKSSVWGALRAGLRARAPGLQPLRANCFQVKSCVLRRVARPAPQRVPAGPPGPPPGHLPRL